MAKNKLTEYDSTASGNLDVGGISVAEGMLPSNVNNAIREQMSHLKDFADGTEAINALAVDNLKMDGNTISSTDTNGDITLDPNGTGDIVLDANVGIGTSSPASDVGLSKIVEVEAATAGFKATATGGSSMEVYSASTASYVDTTTNHPIIFRPNKSEAMRISGGNVLVGGTSAYAASAITMTQDGIFYTRRSGGSPATFRRDSDDGSIVTLEKDGSPVGIIGVGNGSSYTYIGTGDTGLMFNNGNDFIQPWNPSTNANKDNGIDLGRGTSRWKDLFLSGGVYLGGTGSANRLDDYEEGTWTPTYSPATGSFTSITYDTITAGLYTRVGDRCFVEGRIRTDALSVGTGSGILRISGLPFNGNGAISSATIGYVDNFSGNSPRAGYTSGNHIFLIGFPTATGDSNNITVSDLGTSSNNNYIYIAAHYRCT